MLDYAVEYEIVDRNYSKAFAVSEDIIADMENSRTEHIAFTENELATLWSHVTDTKYVDIVLIQCYSGWRPQELGLIKLENVDLEKWLFVGGMKTNAGIERTVPIHSKIRSLVFSHYQEAKDLGSEYLFNYIEGLSNKRRYFMSYKRYSLRFEKVIKLLKLNPSHRPHYPRKTFVTMAKNAKADEYAIKYIVGHSITDITEKVYTERDPDWPASEIEKI